MRVMSILPGVGSGLGASASGVWSVRHRPIWFARAIASKEGPERALEKSGSDNPGICSLSGTGILRRYAENRIRW